MQFGVLPLQIVVYWNNYALLYHDHAWSNLLHVHVFAESRAYLVLGCHIFPVHPPNHHEFFVVDPLRQDKY
ncbi:hypothetical protein D3C77_792160 [compost metagenome]